jgi:hypothetical protein
MGPEGADSDMLPGDVIEMEIRSLDALSNDVVAET